MSSTSLDFAVANHGSIQLLQPLTEDAETWIEHHIPDDAQWFGRAVVVESRYIEPIIIGIENDGLTVAYRS